MPETPRKKARRASITARWNKDLSISLYARGGKVFKTRAPAGPHDVSAFLSGWFGDEKQRVRWVYA